MQSPSPTTPSGRVGRSDGPNLGARKMGAENQEAKQDLAPAIVSLKAGCDRRDQEFSQLVPISQDPARLQVATVESRETRSIERGPTPSQRSQLLSTPNPSESPLSDPSVPTIPLDLRLLSCLDVIKS